MRDVDFRGFFRRPRRVTRIDCQNRQMTWNWKNGWEKQKQHVNLWRYSFQQPVDEWKAKVRSTLIANNPIRMNLISISMQSRSPFPANFSIDKLAEPGANFHFLSLIKRTTQKLHFSTKWGWRARIFTQPKHAKQLIIFIIDFNNLI
jgi:hypothetical protein